MKTLHTLVFILFCQLLFSQSGINWSSTLNVSNNSFGNYHPRVVLNRLGNPMIIWGNSTTSKVYFSFWNGSGFTAPIFLNAPSMAVFAATWAGPDIASKGDTVYVVFKTTPETSDTNHIFLVHSYNGGTTFSTPIRVDYIADSISRFPDVTTDANGNPLVAFMKFDPGFVNARYVVSKSSDFGNTFSTDVLASQYSGGTVCDCCPATIETNNNYIAMMYRDNLNDLRNNWVGVSTDGGNSFPQGMDVDLTNWYINGCPSTGPDGVIIGDTLYSVFMSAASGSALCYINKASLLTMTAQQSIALTDYYSGLSLQNYPRIANYNNAVGIVWRQTSSGNDQLSLKFTNNIFSGLPSMWDTLTQGNVRNTDIALSSNEIHIVWEDDNSGTVKYKKGSYTTNSISEIKPYNILRNIFPNPVSGSEISIIINSNVNYETECSITNTIGQTKTYKITNIENGIGKIDISDLEKGIFFLRININNQSEISKVVKY